MMFWKLGEVGELVGIDAVIVKLLGSVGVADVAPIFCSEGVVSKVAGRENRTFSGEWWDP